MGSIFKMKRMALITIACTLLLAATAFAGVVEDAQQDYQWRLSLVAEQSQRLDMWFAANEGKEITAEQLTYLKSLTDEFIRREDGAIDSGRKYKNALTEHIGEYNREWVLGEINRIEKNEEISSRDRSTALANYKLKEDIYNVLKDFEEKQSTMPKEIIQEIKTDSVDESRTVGYNEYLVYSFSGSSGESISVSLEVINGNPVDVFLLDSKMFANYQSMMLGGAAEGFRDYAVGEGLGIKSKSYTFTFSETDRYYIVIDNTVQPKGGAEPPGQIDVKMRINKEGLLKSIPGFEISLAIALLLVAGVILRKRK